jgi:hypothetical protein
MAALGTGCRFIVTSENKNLKTMAALFALIFIYGHLKPPPIKIKFKIMIEYPLCQVLLGFPSGKFNGHILPPVAN